MKVLKLLGIASAVAAILLALQIGALNAASPAPLALLENLDASSHTRQIAFSKRDVLDHEIGLGAIQKVRGEWRFKHSERLSGSLISYTWQIVDGLSSAQVLTELLDSVAELEGASSRFTCKGRACGQGVQWANRVFREQVLYGREDLQQYQVYAVQGVPSYRLIAYSTRRTVDRQYLHVDLLRIAQ
jgi:Domain of unknown function (DUF4892)